ncbi:MAG TPA: ABC transporter ATP-binding protein [Planctomycetota bacterium]|nr:ABC transporter ATP-binding protein [Planctomycetota bacterium]
MIVVRDLWKIFPGRTFIRRDALQGVTFSLEPGEIGGLLGRSGAGKSTTLKILAGLLRPTQGSASIDVWDVVVWPTEARRRVGYVPESGGVFEDLSPLEFLTLVGRFHGLDPETLRERSTGLLRRFDVDLLLRKDLPMREFSRGMKQEVLLAAALLHDPPVFLLDDPFQGLDLVAKAALRDLLRRLAGEGKTVLLACNDLEVARDLCTRLIVLREGKVAATGTPSEMLRASGKPTLEEAFAALADVGDALRDLDGLLQGLKERAT